MCPMTCSLLYIVPDPVADVFVYYVVACFLFPSIYPGHVGTDDEGAPAALRQLGQAAVCADAAHGWIREKGNSSVGPKYEYE